MEGLHAIVSIYIDSHVFVIRGQDRLIFFMEILSICRHFGPLTRYAKLRVAHAPGTFSPPPRVSDPDMHHSTCASHVSWCMAGETFPAFPAHAHLVILSGERPILDDYLATINGHRIYWNERPVAHSRLMIHILRPARHWFRWQQRAIMILCQIYPQDKTPVNLFTIYNNILSW